MNKKSATAGFLLGFGGRLKSRVQQASSGWVSVEARRVRFFGLFGGEGEPKVLFTDPVDLFEQALQACAASRMDVMDMADFAL